MGGLKGSVIVWRVVSAIASGECVLLGLPEGKWMYAIGPYSGKIDVILAESRILSLQMSTGNGVATLPHLIHVIVSTDGRSLP